MYNFVNWVWPGQYWLDSVKLYSYTPIDMSNGNTQLSIYKYHLKINKKMLWH